MSRPPARLARGAAETGGAGTAGASRRDLCPVHLARLAKSGAGLMPSREVEAHAVVPGRSELAGQHLGMAAQQVLRLRTVGHHHRLDAAVQSA